MIRLGFVDDHPGMLEGVTGYLAKASPDIEMLRCAGTVEALLGAGETYDVVMLDLRLGDGTTPRENVARLRGTGARVLVYCDSAPARDAAAAVVAGALGVVDKAEPMSRLEEAIREVAAGGTAVSSRLAQVLETMPAQRTVLSRQEREVLRLYATDLPAKSVARRMGITEGTVKEYLKRIRAKLAAEGGPASTKLELRSVAEGMGLLDGQGRSPGR
jgi:DNA-binding NarL/FixJ family response regulator